MPQLSPRSIASAKSWRRGSTTTWPDQPSPPGDLLRAADAAFDAREIDAALAVLAPDVAWPRAFTGGVARGRAEVQAYWTEQWSEIDPHVEPTAFHPEAAGRVLVHVHQVVRGRAGAGVGGEPVGHRFTTESGRIRAVEVSPPPTGDDDL
jgi:hypothetical protein